jgi:YbbR domain-containing protein
MLRWLTTNLRTFLLAFALALAVWVTAVTAADPDETRTYPSPVQIEFIGQDPGLVITGNVPSQVEITLRAPRSVWDSLLAGSDSLRAVVDLTGLSSGVHLVSVQLQITARPVKIIATTPAAFDLTLEELVARSLPVELVISGLPATGYQAGQATLSPTSVVISGPASLVSQVFRLQAALDLTDLRQSIETSLPIQAVNDRGETVSGLTIHPDSLRVALPLTQQGGYRDLAVKVVTVGGLASGYRLKNITVSPLIVTVYSGDTNLVNSLPGYVETMPLNLSGASENIQTQLSLNLPSNVTVVGEQTVLVQVEIVPLENSLTIAYRPIEVVGLPGSLRAHLSPQTVDVILSGPAAILNTLTASDVNIQLDLTGLAPGTYYLTPGVTIAKQGLTVESILPGTVEVIITASATPTP